MQRLLLFDEVLTTVVQTIEQWPYAKHLKTVTVIRGPLGRVQLALEGKSALIDKPLGDIELEFSELQEQLQELLGVYWRALIWAVEEPPGVDQDSHQRWEKISRAARDGSGGEGWESLWDTIREQRGTPWRFPPGSTDPPFEWYKIEKVFSSAAWLTPPRGSLWPLQPDVPAIVAFYSFKGGVGRSLAAAAIAILLARAGKRVMLVDLDLEAPGLGELFFDASALGPGVIDYFLEYQLTSPPASLSSYVATITDVGIIGEQGEPLRLLHAGSVNAHFPEKISRLDWSGFSTGSPVSASRELLAQVKKQYKPDFILLDARSGIHDLGGISLLHLSHLAVLFSRDTPSGWSGLRVVLELLREALHRPAFFLVEPLILPEVLAAGSAWDEKFQGQAQRLMEELGFPEELADLGAALYGIPLLYDKTLHTVRRITPGIVEHLASASDYRRLTQEICLQMEQECEVR